MVTHSHERQLTVYKEEPEAQDTPKDNGRSLYVDAHLRMLMAVLHVCMITLQKGEFLEIYKEHSMGAASPGVSNSNTQWAKISNLDKVAGQH